MIDHNIELIRGFVSYLGNACHFKISHIMTFEVFSTYIFVSSSLFIF